MERGRVVDAEVGESAPRGRSREGREGAGGEVALVAVEGSRRTTRHLEARNLDVFQI